MGQDLFNDRWKDPRIFQKYEDEGRWMHRPAIAKVASRTIYDFVLPGRILEVGAGIGELAALAGPEYAKRAIQVEQNPEFVRINQERFPNSTVVVGDVYQLQFPDSSFNTVIGYSVLDTLDNLTVALREIHRVLQNGGRLIHLLDLSPDPSVIMKDYGDNRALFPHPIGRYIFSGFRVVDKEEYKKARVKINPRVVGFLDKYVNDPYGMLQSLKTRHIRDVDTLVFGIDGDLEGLGFKEVINNKIGRA